MLTENEGGRRVEKAKGWGWEIRRGKPKCPENTP